MAFMAAGWLAAGRSEPMQGGRETGQALSALEDLTVCCLPVAPIPPVASPLLRRRRYRSQMGGNNCHSSMRCDIDAAVHLDHSVGVCHSWQRRTRARRLLLKSGAQGDAFLARLVAVSQRLTPGNWDDELRRLLAG